MGTRIWKETLCKGRQRDRWGNWFAFTSDDIRQAHRNVNRMLSRGVPVPCVWEHQPVEAGDPDEHRAAYAKYTFAHVAGSRINARGNLELLHDVPDPADVRQLAKTRFVSPKVYPSYSDSLGGEYSGTTIAHVAATPNPVQTWQKPFELSRGKALYLSYTPEGKTVAEDTKPKDGDGDGKAGETKAGGKASLMDVIAALKDVGMNIPDEVTDETGLVIAIKASGGGGFGGSDDDDELDDELPLGGAGDTTVAGAGGPVMMSNGPQTAQWAKAERADMKTRVKNLFATGRVDRPTARQLLRQVGTVEMSFTRDAEPVCPLLKKIAEHEKKAANSAWQANGGRSVDLSATAGFDLPEKLRGKEGTDTDVIKRQEELAQQYSVTAKK